DTWSGQARREVKLTDQLAQKIAQPVSVFIFGDMMLGRHVESGVTRNDLSGLFKNIIGEVNGEPPRPPAGGTPPPKGGDVPALVRLSMYHVVIANLEGPVVQTRAPKFKEIQFGFDPVVVPQLKSWGFDAFSLANNHALDQHYAGLEETKKHIEGNGLVWFGDQVKESDEYVKFIERAEKKIALIGFNTTDNPFSIEEMKSVVKKAKEQAHIVIVMMHWGTEYQYLGFSPQQQEIAHALADSGADIVIGSHPHVVQPMEVYHGVPIFYSLGNFIFDQYFSQYTQEGLALGLVIDEQTIQIHFFPFSSQRSIPQWMAQDTSDLWLNAFYEKSLLAEALKVQGSVITINRK
ncbi:MAG TPA: CapA family protein, partial [Patescibacteria group bacterium]|nr:CapA family protein [Patescibacteria group bacterium]